MKKIYTLLLITIAFQLIPFTPAVASNYLGGEITWQCMANGQYIFRLTLYRDCGGLGFPQTFQIQTTVPSVPTIVVNKIAQNDLSATGFQANGTSACPSCASGSSPFPGVVDENIYESNPINLSGVPPAAGWSFYFDMCCRNGTVLNLSNPTAQGMRVLSKMFAYNNQNAFPCYDASPYFAEPPANVMCAGQPAALQYLSIDSDDDFLTYRFTDALNDQGAAIPVSFGYSTANPLPGPVQNPSNTVMSLDTLNGETLFTVNTMGNFNINMCVTSYRNGTKISEINRGHDFYILSNCPTVAGSQPNLYPSGTAPFADPVSGLFTSYKDTVLAGSTVTFQKIITDNDFFLNGVAQDIRLTGAGNQFGANFTNASSGCLMPPCATLDAALPKVFSPSDTTLFTWTTNNAHLASSGPLQAKTWYFLLRAMDNYCPAPGMHARIASITVVNSLSGLNEQEEITNMTIYPNPVTTESFEISWSSISQKPLSVTISDITGREILRTSLTQTAGKNKATITLPKTATGMYLLQAVSASGYVKKQKIVIGK